MFCDVVRSKNTQYETVLWVQIYCILIRILKFAHIWILLGS